MVSPLKKQEEIFCVFHQGDNSISKRYGGSGLGLSIVKELTELMGGTVSVSSCESKGSIFTLFIPFRKIEGEITPLDRNGAKKKIPGQFKDLKVLLAEDYVVNRDLIRHHLEGTGCKLVTADNGVDAVKLFREVKPDLVLMDIQMPELDGVGATRLIRNEEDGHSVCIIGVTANAFPQDLKKYWKAGMNDCLVKPFRKQDLFDKISHWEKFSRMNWGIHEEGIPKISEEDSLVFEPHTLMNRVDNDREMGPYPSGRVPGRIPQVSETVCGASG